MDPIQDVKTIGIVGGGKVGLHLYELFGSSRFSKVSFIVDLNENSPAMVAAKEDHVQTFTNLNEALKKPVDFIFEVTGNAKVSQILSDTIDPSLTKLVTHDTARIILEVVSEGDQKIKNASIDEIQQIKTEILSHMTQMDQFVDRIEGMMTDMQMLSINARIEAARVGEQGRGFEVVASEMGKSANTVREITEEIAQIARAIGQTSKKIDLSLEKLK